ncbi:MAG: LEA type 2 family protein [Bacteroidales bacterium]|jgi:LEA14-like dessication related protein|nr:LEA type 2 family protein [Bacteroidales bacterium]
MKRIRNLIPLLLVVFVLSSCSIYKAVDIGDVDNVDFKGMVDNKVNLNLKVPISNPNGYKIKIKSMDLDLKINGKYIGKMTIANDIVIPSKSEEAQDFPVEIIVKNPLGSMATLYKIRNAKSFEMEINGTIKVKALINSKIIKVSEKQRVKL